MTISKLTNNIQPLDEVDKINEIIDELGNIDTLPSQTGNANKFLTTDGTDASWSAVPTRNIGEIVESAIPLTDAGLHLLDGALIQGSGIYSDFVTYISGLVSTYPDLFITEANWQSAVTNYGVCGKFVYDSTNNTVRLPKITGIVEGTTDVTALGDLVQAGLPIHTHTRGTMDITGSVGGDNKGFGHVGNVSYGLSVHDTQVSGAFYKDATTKFTATKQTEQGSNGKSLGFKASNNWTGSTSNPNYSNSSIQNSSTVQPQTIKVLYYIVVATTTKTEIEVDIDEIATDLNGKLDIAGGTMTGQLYVPRLGCSGNGTNNNFDFKHNVKPTSGWYLNADRLEADEWYEIMPLKEKYVNGSSWYRVWADGWIEQGGSGNYNNGGAIVFAKTFTNTNYSIQVSPRGVPTNATSDNNWLAFPLTKSTNKCTVRLIDSDSADGRNGAIEWFACGY